MSMEREEQRWGLATRLMVGTAVVAGLWLVPSKVYASIFTSIISSVQNIANIEGQISKSQSAINQFTQTVIAPVQEMNAVKSWMSHAESAYQGYFAQIGGLGVRSATLPATTSLESALRMGYTGGTGSAVSGAYANVYGGPLSTTVVDPAIAAEVDMKDATAQEAMSLAANSDAATEQLLGYAKNLEQSAAVTAPGTADQVAAQATALQLQSHAMMHRVLASLLRQEAVRLASVSAQWKHATAIHSQAWQSISGGPNE